jgi:hypothetical protein
VRNAFDDITGDRRTRPLALVEDSVATLHARYVEAAAAASGGRL